MKQESKVLSLSTEDLKVDERYQRELNMSRVRKIAKAYNPKKLGVLIVSKRSNGFYYVVDGRHRVKATELKYGKPHALLCQVYEGLTYEEECELFYSQYDNCSKVKPYQKFIAKVEGKDEDALGLLEVLQNVGLVFRKGSGENSLRCVQLLEKLYSTMGAKELERMLRTIVTSFGGFDDTFHSSLVGGMGVFYSTYGADIDDNRAVKRFQKVTPKEFLQRGRILDKNVKDGVAVALFKEYNKNGVALEHKGIF